jgi:hypothetical protein
MKIRFERNRRYIFIEMKSLFLNFILPDTPVALLRFKDENRRELYYFLELNIEIQLLVKSTKEEKNS